MKATSTSDAVEGVMMPHDALQSRGCCSLCLLIKPRMWAYLERQAAWAGQRTDCCHAFCMLHTCALHHWQRHVLSRIALDHTPRSIGKASVLSVAMFRTAPVLRSGREAPILARAHQGTTQDWQCDVLAPILHVDHVLNQS